MSLKLSVTAYEEGIANGNIAILSRAITLVESTLEEDKKIAKELIDKILPRSGNSIRVGITGVPGVGKSTFIESLGMLLLKLNKKVAVLAIDPSSSKSKGSILGDKTRMEQLSVQKNAFIRPSASSGNLGGVRYKTQEAIWLCEAAGFDVILIETVGVGQSETEVSQICDFFLLLMLSGAGDELQGIKRGIMELADALIITKADGANKQKAKNASIEYARALHYMPQSENGWIPKVSICSAYENDGIEKVWEIIKQFQEQQIANNYFEKKRKNQNIEAFHRLLNEHIYNDFFNDKKLKEKINTVEIKIKQGELSPYSALQNLLEKKQIKIEK